MPHDASELPLALGRVAGLYLLDKVLQLLDSMRDFALLVPQKLDFLNRGLNFVIRVIVFAGRSPVSLLAGADVKNGGTCRLTLDGKDGDRIRLVEGDGEYHILEARVVDRLDLDSDGFLDRLIVELDALEGPACHDLGAIVFQDGIATGAFG